eukprot:g906.t1
MPTLLLLLLLVLAQPWATCSWKRWAWDHIYTYPNESNSTLRMKGRTVARAPDGRQGHSFNLMGNDTVVLFGGRALETTEVHQPRSMDITQEGGATVIKSYQGRNINPTHEECLAAARVAVLETERCIVDGLCDIDEEEELIKCGTEVRVGPMYNDIWVYNLGCERWDDLSCRYEGWTEIFKNLRYGGCKIITTAIKTSEVCPAPTERYGHAAAVYGTDLQDVEAKIFIYGGFSQFCSDFCSDMWVWYFDLAKCHDLGLCDTEYGCTTGCWQQIPTLEKDRLERTKNGIKTGEMREPGKRWRFATVQDNQRMFMFGGHRLWHGYHRDNSLENQYSSTGLFNPKGGYLQDFYYLDLERGEWTQITKKRTCYPKPGIRWDERNNIECIEMWPKARASAALSLVGDTLYLHGGFQTHFPYPHLESYGSGRGTAFISTNAGPKPFPTHNYWLDDFWKYNLTTGIWEEIQPNGPVPEARSDHIMVAAGDGRTLILHGGYYTNYRFESLWIYDIERNVWREKRDFVYPLYPDSCTDDFALPRHDRLRQVHREFGRFSRYQDTEDDEEHDHVKLYTSEEGYNVTSSLAAIDRPRTFSVWGEPTRHFPTDGKFGRASSRVRIRQPRRQAVGWDGCRDRVDDDFLDARGPKYNIRWEQPEQRSSHRALWAPKHRLLLVFGGSAYGTYKPNPFRPRWTDYEDAQDGIEVGYKTGFSPYASVISDMWAWHQDVCIRNCSFHGQCIYGTCICDNGYYGLDCSNISCPGDYCYYDDVTLEQHCTHCCSAPYVHQDDDVYIPDYRKVPCDANHSGTSNGICDGFGSCQCRPPMLTPDCSVKDCRQNCSGNGWCSLEYPVGRCMCDRPYFGEVCEFRFCPNNCTPPNGFCNYTSGECICGPTFNPYNHTLLFEGQDFSGNYTGMDCSYITIFAGASHAALGPVFFFVVFFSMYFL